MLNNSANGRHRIVFVPFDSVSAGTCWQSQRATRKDVHYYACMAEEDGEACYISGLARRSLSQKPEWASFDDAKT